MLQSTQQLTPLIDPNVKGAIFKHKEISEILTNPDMPLHEQLARHAAAMREYMTFVGNSERLRSRSLMNESVRGGAKSVVSRKRTGQTVPSASDELENEEVGGRGSERETDGGTIIPQRFTPDVAKGETSTEVKRRKNMEDKVTIFDNTPGYMTPFRRKSNGSDRGARRSTSQLEESNEMKHFVTALREGGFDVGNDGSISKGKFQKNASEGMRLLRDAVGRNILKPNLGLAG